MLDAAIAGHMDDFRSTVIFAAGYFVLVGVVAFGAMIVSTKLAALTLKALRTRVFAGIMKRDMEQFHAVNTADYLSALNNDINTVSKDYLDPLLEGVMHAVRFVVALGVMQKRQAELSQKMSEFMVKLKDFLSGFEVIKSYRMGKHTAAEFDRNNARIFRAQYRVGKAESVTGGLSLIFSLLVQTTAIVLSAYFIIRGLPRGRCWALSRPADFWWSRLAYCSRVCPASKVPSLFWHGSMRLPITSMWDLQARRPLR